MITSKRLAAGEDVAARIGYTSAGDAERALDALDLDGDGQALALRIVDGGENVSDRAHMLAAIVASSYGEDGDETHEDEQGNILERYGRTIVRGLDTGQWRAVRYHTRQDAARAFSEWASELAEGGDA